jgi:hypothetical protein
MRSLLLLCLCLAPVAAAQDAALRVVEACRARLDAQSDVGIERVERRCPELRAALRNAAWRDLLPVTLGERREQISAASLGALMELVKRSGDAAALRPAPDREVLAGVLTALGAQGQEGATRWERFKRWLQQKFQDRKDDDEAGWLEKWSRQLRTSEGVAQAITYIGYGLVMALVGYVILAELRAAGLMGGIARSRRRAGPAAEWRRRLLLTDVFDAPLSERPGMLLKLLGEALSRARRLPAPEGLTASAITRRAQLDTEAERVQLQRVAAAAELARYAPQAPGTEELEQAVAAARALLGKFTRLPPERG